MVTFMTLLSAPPFRTTAEKKTKRTDYKEKTFDVNHIQ